MFFLIGANNQRPVFPFDMTPTGAPGCRLYHSIGSQTFVSTDAAGSARLSLPLPNDRALVSVRAYASALVIDISANNAGLVTSNYGRLLLGL